MSINSFDIYLVNRIQEKERINLDRTKQLFGKSSSTVRRSIQNINEFLPLNKQFIISDLTILSQLTYEDYLNFTQSLSFSEYAPNQKERFDLIITLSFIKGTINLSSLYDELGLSISTKKKDRQMIEDYLKRKQFTLKTTPGKGVSIHGKELYYRIFVAQLLLKVCELDEDNQIFERQANNPVERKIFQLYNDFLSSSKTDCYAFLNSFFKEHEYRIGYLSKKFLYLYYLLTDHRTSAHVFITEKYPIPLTLTNYYFVSDLNENVILNCLFCSLDFNGKSPTLLDKLLEKATHYLIHTVENQIITTFYTKNALFEQCYHYLYKAILRNFLNFDFYDNKLEDTKKEYSYLFHIVSSVLNESDLKYYFPLDENQIATLTLIFRNHVLKNKVSGRNRKKVVIVTNSAKEKTNFFAETLVHHVDIEIMDSVHINELHLLSSLKFDYLITFSNRISAILIENHYPVIKLNYYLHDDDIEILLNIGFSNSSNRKLLAKDFCKEISTVPQNEREEYLIANYPSFFI
ncbi:helix-turn-helix domain-containing protein [Carnobacterium sp.]|uniref:helix-turn-helix domain-containing protein n=1 Tax=Carnobacterium sp. TaxID=48221 RepID=UPI0028AE9110|nr:helix-turn-helix domain-containing protein [Carnobacterium sp.]